MNNNSFMNNNNIGNDSFLDTQHPAVIFQPPAVFHINKVAVALGLLWQPLRNDLSLKQQAKLASGNRHNLDLFRMAANSKQVGFASSREGYSSNMLAGANLFDQNISVDSWLAAFKLTEESDHWWIVAKRYGAIYQDKVFDSSKSALDEYSILINAPDWERKFAPSDWNIKDTEELRLVDALTLNQHLGLKPINQTKVWLVAIPLVLTLIALVIFAGIHLLETMESRDVQLPRPEEPDSQPQVERPWVGKSRIGEFTSICLELMEELFFLSPGWKIDTLACSQDSSRYLVSASIKRNPSGSTGFLRQFAFKYTGTDIAIGCNGDCANIQKERSIPNSPSREDERLWQAGKVDTILRERFQTLHADLHLNQRGPRSSVQNTTPPTAISSRHDFSIKTRYGIREYADLLRDVPGIVPETLIYKPSNNLWLLTARIFHHVEIPLISET
ncbi:MAG: type 4b pilus protein PilO2 [Paracoccaceae bacterium]|nr:type 4b pilus protein PilO2 [Paracoccaceae bacterium]MDE2675572.1 type 4b pilus protein PilO2 [Paracoccaceae bacterium]